ncbi:MAG: zinc-binding dehydrogenase [Actinomycetota bacterium]|nr:zinc-binding dehydrogenase [Actinomycetota bacterium]
MQVACAGVCNTDLACHTAKIPTQRPIVLGHEGAGIVLEIASDVASVAVGDRVVMSFMSCGTCSSCLKGTVAYCRHNFQINMLGGGLDGTRCYVGSEIRSHFFGQSSFATLAVSSERNVVRVPDQMTLPVAAPFGCGILTGAGTVLNSLRVRPGQSVAVFGAGAVGMSAAMVAAIAGASPIVMVDMVESRLDLALSLGVDIAINAADPGVVDEIERHTRGGADYCIEASGSPTALGQAIDAIGPAGVCACVGGTRGAVPFDPQALRIKGGTIRGVVEGDADPRLLLPYLFKEFERGRLPVDRFMETYAFTDIGRAFEDAAAGLIVKPVLSMNGD